MRGAILDEITRMGDRDVVALCLDAREIVVRRDATVDLYQQALRNSFRATQLAPWSAYCVGVFGMAKYRTGDYSGAIETLESASAAKPENLSAGLAFTAMSLQRLGHTAEAKAVAEKLWSRTATSTDVQLANVLAELDLVLGSPPAKPRPQ
jgi:hypothetical protein